MNLCLPYTPCLVHPPMDSYLESWVPLCVTACVSQSPYFCCYTLFRMCTCISTWILCLPYTTCLVYSLSIVTWKVGCPCVSLHVCPSHLNFVATPCLECVHASVHEFMSTLHHMSGPSPMHSLMETWVPLYDSVFVSLVSHFCCHTLFRMCTCISTWILCLPYTPCLVHPLWIGYMEIWVPLCVTLSVSHSPWLWSHTLFRMCTCISTWIYVYLTLHVWSTPYGIGTWKVGCPRVSLHVCPSHLISVATPCLECVHASVHEFMSTWLLMCGPPPMHSLMETGCPCMAVCLCPSQSHFCWHTLFRMCTCISTWIYVHLAAYVWSTPYALFDGTWVPFYDSVFVSQSSHFCCHTLFRMCTCISTWIYVYLTPHVWSTPYG